MWWLILLIILAIVVSVWSTSHRKKKVHFADDNLEVVFRGKDPPAMIGRAGVVPMATRDAHGADMDT